MTASRPFAGRVALVTGASSGIGRAIARRLAACGAAVGIGYSGGRQAAAELADELSAAGGQAAAIGADLRSAQAPAELVHATQARLGPVGLLVSNAGLARWQDWEDVTSADFDEVVAVNLRAPFLLAQAAAGGMQDRGFGRILFVSSVAAFTGGVVGPHYAASKAGLHAITHFLAARLARHGVTVNAIAPGLIETPMLPEDSAPLRDRVPVGRLGQPEEVADLAVAVLGNAYLTSQVISADGGMYPR